MNRLDTSAKRLAKRGAFDIPGFDPEVLRTRTVIFGGLGNIGHPTATAMAPYVGRMLLVDRDRVEAGNLTNQAYANHVGWFKVNALADQLQTRHPHLQVETFACEVAELSWGDVDRADLAVAGFDSLLARQQFHSELIRPLDLPAIDAGVGSPMVATIKTLLPGQACLECSWGARQYNTLATEYPCHGPLPSTSAVSPLLLGQTTGTLLATTALALLTGNGPTESTELSCDLLHQRFLSSRLHRSPRCRHEHQPVTGRVPIPVPWERATLGDVIAAARLHLRSPECRFEFRRLTTPNGLFSGAQQGDSTSLAPLADRPVDSLGLRPRDYVRAWSGDRSNSVMLHFAVP